MQTLRPLEADGSQRGLMQTIYDTQQVAAGSFINSYGQVSMKSLKIREPQQQNKKPVIRGKSTQRSSYRPIPLPQRHQPYDQHHFETIG